MRKIVTIAIMVLIGVSAVYGQNEILKKINEIKANKDAYYWGQYTHPDAETAIAGASKSVLLDVNIHCREKNLPERTVEEILPAIKTIKISRGSLTRIFAYVRIADLFGEQAFAGNPEEGSQQPSVSVPVAPMPKEFVPDAFTQKILQQTEFQSVYKFLAAEKAQGQLLQFGSLNDVEEYDSLDLILFDLQSKEVVSLLSPVVQGNKRVNKVTGAIDSLENYPEEMMAVIWYIK